MKKFFYVITGRSGFTLTELLVIISILSVLAVISIPSYMSWMPSYQLKSAARDVISNMQLARLEAVKRNMDCVVTTDVGANTYKIDIGATTIKTVSLADYGKGITLCDSGSTTSAITFSSRGMATFNPVPADGLGKVFITNSKNTAKYGLEVTSVGTMTLKNK
jgi:prepilin-type N-terminal cleavage/methylation domain-containing protein